MIGFLRSANSQTWVSLAIPAQYVTSNPARPALRVAPARALRSFARITRPPVAVAGALLACLLAGVLAGPLTAPARGEATWTTYHRDLGRSGDDPDATEPIVPVEDWQSPDLGAPIWSQPLILGSRAYVATVGDEIYALNVATGEVVWEKSVGTPVPSGELPCGDITPTVGIVGTPVIDASSQVIYAVADTWNPATKEAHHVLKGLSLASGTEVLSTPVDPPGSDPKAILQRTALNLDAGKVVFGFGGNDGDCSDYRGAVAAAPESGGGSPLYWQVPIAPPSLWGGAIWAPSGPAVDGEGNIYATTGNPDPPPGEPAITYDYSDSVVKLNPSLSLIGHFESPNWLEESNNDLDLSSSGAELLPGGLLFQAGKDGVGYLIDESTMGSAAAAVYSAPVCGGRGSFGGEAYADGVIYIACTNGVQALSYDQAAKTFTPLWQGPGDAFGPPIVSGGLVWSLATGGFKGGGTKLYGIEPVTGRPLYTETLPSPVIDHFGSPSAAGGRLFVASGVCVTAYQIAKLSPPGSVEAPAGRAAGGCPSTSEPVTPASAASTAMSTADSPATPSSAHAPAAPAPLLAHTHLRAGANGRVRLTLRCARGPSACRGTVTLRARFVVSAGNGRDRARRVLYVTLAHTHFGPAKGGFTVTIQLNAGARAHLRLHHDHLALQVVIAPTAGKARRVVAVLT
jgi:polyvinyl alcohol dehydrogenase (cytochrome)